MAGIITILHIILRYLLEIKKKKMLKINSVLKGLSLFEKEKKKEQKKRERELVLYF